MAINLKNREAEQLLNALSRRTSLGKTKIVLDLLRAESARQERRMRSPKAVRDRDDRYAAAGFLIPSAA